jgi:hypothetical protein
MKCNLNVIAAIVVGMAITTNSLAQTSPSVRLSFSELPPSTQVELLASTNITTWQTITISSNAVVMPMDSTARFFRGRVVSGNHQPWKLDIKRLQSEIVTSYYHPSEGTITNYNYNYTGVANFTNTTSPTSTRWFIPPSDMTNCTMSNITQTNSIIRVMRRRDGCQWLGNTTISFGISNGEQYAFTVFGQNSTNNRVDVRIDWE